MIITDVNRELDRIQDEEGIRVLYAVENGSRAWGIASQNSDYDIRFIYARPWTDYVSVRPKQDSIERKVDTPRPDPGRIDNLDFVGFDIVKFARLLANSNPTCIEWLVSGIVYRDNNTLGNFEKFARGKFDARKLYYHYASMCKSNYMKYLHSKKEVTYKKYLYALRGMVNALYVLNVGGIPGPNLAHTAGLLNGTYGYSIDTYNELMDIIEKKKSGNEGDIIQNLATVDNTIEAFLNDKPKLPESKPIDTNWLDSVIQYNLVGVERNGEIR